MNNTLREDLYEYIDKLKAIYGEYLAQVIVYGACAKSSFYDKDTDIEILILVELDDNEIKEYQNVLTEATYEMFLDKSLYITPIVINVNYFMEWKDSHKFYRKINQEGIKLYEQDTIAIHKTLVDDSNREIKVAAYQCKVTDDIKENFETICKAVEHAKEEQVDLIVFPECSLTGYPSINIETSEDVDFETVEFCLNKLEKMAQQYNIYIIVGTVTKHRERIYNSAVLLTTDRKRYYYNKRCLWGKDKENFSIGEEAGIFAVNGIKIGVRIGCEVHFPEYFRELYREKTELNITLFYDQSDIDNKEEYNKTMSYMVTRAAENICYTLTSNILGPSQCAPTVLLDKSGNKLVELDRHSEGLLIYNIDNFQRNYEEEWRNSIADRINKG